MSVWLQALGEFFWVFLMNEANDLEVYKIMGETELLDDKAVCFLKPNRCHQQKVFVDLECDRPS